MIYYVYSLRDPREEMPFYIGKGKNSRAEFHLTETYSNTTNRKKWCKIESIRQAGLEVVIEYLHTDLDENTAYELEAELISKYGRKDLDPNGILTNICVDNRPPVQSVPCSAEKAKKIGDAQRGELNHRFGKHWNKEQKELRRQFALKNGVRPPDRTGIFHTDETKAKQSQAAKGKKKSPEHCKAIGDARRGKPLGPCSPQKAKKIAEAQYRDYKLVSPSGLIFHVNTKQLRDLLLFEKLNYGCMMAVKDKPKKYRGWSLECLGLSKDRKSIF